MPEELADDSDGGGGLFPPAEAVVVQVGVEDPSLWPRWLNSAAGQLRSNGWNPRWRGWLGAFSAVPSLVFLAVLWASQSYRPNGKPDSDALELALSILGAGVLLVLIWATLNLTYRRKLCLQLAEQQLAARLVARELDLQAPVGAIPAYWRVASGVRTPRNELETLRFVPTHLDWLLAPRRPYRPLVGPTFWAAGALAFFAVLFSLQGLIFWARLPGMWALFVIEAGWAGLLCVRALKARIRREEFFTALEQALEQVLPDYQPRQPSSLFAPFHPAPGPPRPLVERLNAITAQSNYELPVVIAALVVLALPPFLTALFAVLGPFGAPSSPLWVPLVQMVLSLALAWIVLRSMGAYRLALRAALDESDLAHRIAIGGIEEVDPAWLPRVEAGPKAGSLESVVRHVGRSPERYIACGRKLFTPGWLWTYYGFLLVWLLGAIACFSSGGMAIYTGDYLPGPFAEWAYPLLAMLYAPRIRIEETVRHFTQRLSQ